MVLKWHNLIIEYKTDTGTKRETGPFTGHVDRGQIHAIISDRPTLGRALIYRLAIEQVGEGGEILWNGHPRDPRDWIKRMAFIPSGHHLIVYKLTVRERLLKAISLRRPDLKGVDRTAFIEWLLDLTELSHRQGSQMEGGQWQLSRLQNKLAALAVELTGNPQILFVMDPFKDFMSGEGTDRYMLDDVIQYGRVLKSIAEEMSLAVIIQLDDGHYLTDLPIDTVTVALEGHPFYHGDYCELLVLMSQILGYSAVQCVVLLQRLLNPHPQNTVQIVNYKQQLIEKLPKLASYQPHRWPVLTCTRPPEAKSPSPPTILSILTAAQLAEDIRHWSYWLCTMISYSIVYLLLSFLYFQMPLNVAGLYDRQGLFYFISFNLLLLNGLPQLVRFRIQEARIEHEHRLRLVHGVSFVLSQFITSLLFPLLLITIWGTALYYITGLRTDGFQYVVVFLADLLLLAGTSVALGMMTAAIFNTIESSQLALPFLAAIFFVYGNLAFAPNPTWILRWIQYLTPLYYSSQCLLQNELSGTRATKDGTRLNQFLHDRGLDQMPIAACLPALFGFTLLFLIITCIIVETRNKRYFT